MTQLSRGLLLDNVRQLFARPADLESRRSMALGAELEMIPVRADAHERVPAKGGTPSGSELLASMGRKYGWTEEPMGSDPACWTLPEGRVTFEPGGQIEFSSAVFPTAQTLLDCFDEWLPRFHAHAHQMGIVLNTIGIEDRVPVARVPLQLNRERYRRMTQYFDSVGPFGVIMMRQTASLQLNIDRGERPLDRWRLLNALAPFLTAIFANSPRYAAAETGHRSYRAHVWRNLDPRRTGIVYAAGSEAEEYLEFALNAPVILGGGDAFPTFAQLLSTEQATLEQWETHLSTLFPEVRPREYFEVRSIDSIPAEFVPAAIVLIAGLVYSEATAAEAMMVLGPPSADLLVRAGALGLADETLRAGSATLVRMAMEGCRVLGSSYISEKSLSRASDFFDEYTLQGRSPADG